MKALIAAILMVIAGLAFSGESQKAARAPSDRKAEIPAMPHFPGSLHS